MRRRVSEAESADFDSAPRAGMYSTRTWVHSTGARVLPTGTGVHPAGAWVKLTGVAGA